MARPDIERMEIEYDPDWGDGYVVIDIEDHKALLAYIAELEGLLREAHYWLPVGTEIEGEIATLVLEQPAHPESEQP